jgi:hypothetical protein
VFSEELKPHQVGATNVLSPLQASSTCPVFSRHVVMQLSKFVQVVWFFMKSGVECSCWSTAQVEEESESQSL